MTKLKISTWLTNLYELVSTDSNNMYVWAFVLIILYLLYRNYFYKRSFKAQYPYNQQLKNKGKTLPSFPNGWYVALHSHELQAGGDAVSIDIAGENMVAFRNKKTKEAYILEAYCKHLGANLGVGGKVVKQKCVQCPFHGWLYDGDSGLCVDYDGKPVEMHNCEYNQNLGEKGVKLEWKQKDNVHAQLRKYPVCEMNGFIYVWVHALEKYQNTPLYPMLNIEEFSKKMEYRAKTLHVVKSHMQDIPENGADAGHFKFVHNSAIQNSDLVTYLWQPRWKRGDDPEVAQMFHHKKKYIDEFKQEIYHKFFEPYPYKNFLSVGYIDNFIKIPLLGYVFMLNITIIQVGSSTVFIFLKSPAFTCVLFHYLRPIQSQKIHVHHETWSYWYCPYWLSALITKMDLVQVSGDMQVWDTKRFARNIYFKKGDKYDEYLKGWREWFSQYYEGCKLKEKKEGLEW